MTTPSNVAEAINKLDASDQGELSKFVRPKQQ